MMSELGDTDAQNSAAPKVQNPFPYNAQPDTMLERSYNYTQPSWEPIQETQGVESVQPQKHRRSRLGCFTCRSRRVKCDETRPVCIRCQKAQRQCGFPNDDVPSKSRSQKRSLPRQEEPSSQSAIQSPIPVKTPSSITSTFRDEISESPPLSHTQSVSPTTQPSRLYSPFLSDITLDFSVLDNLSDPMARFYLEEHFMRNMTYSYWGLQRDNCGFIHHFLIGHALNFEPLRWALLAFVSYNYTVRNGAAVDGQLEDFLPYYSKALVTLYDALQSNSESIDLLLTMLQLACLEEYFGDWVNLLKHQKAAFEMLCKCYSRETATGGDLHNTLFEWYVRFDIFARFLSGSDHQIGLDESWFNAHFEYFLERRRRYPEDFGVHVDEKNAHNRHLVARSAILHERLSHNQITRRSFDAEMEDVHHALFFSWQQDVPGLPNTGKGFSNPEVLVEDEIWRRDLLNRKLMLIRNLGAQITYKIQLAKLHKEQPEPEVYEKTKQVRAWYKEIESETNDPGLKVAMQAPFSFACLFIRDDHEEIEWCRRSLARIEQEGYIYPMVFKQHLSNAWNMDITHWWLDNDEELWPILARVRQFCAYRTQTPTDSLSQDLREMSGIFKSLSLEGHTPVTSSPKIWP